MYRLTLLLFPTLAGCGVEWVPYDLDGDGKTPLQGDCWESLSGGDTRGPDVAEVWYDGVDQNCDGKSDFDKDLDGVDAVEHGGTDCWDDPDLIPPEFEALNGFAQLSASQVLPGADDSFYDGVDANCDGQSDFDQDGDGYDTSNEAFVRRDGSLGDDCYDSSEDDDYPFTVRTDPGNEGVLDGDALDPVDVNPASDDAWYDGTDANCDGANDFDQDGDSYERDDECNDVDDTIFPDPSIPEVWYNDIDENCDGNLYDQDYDGHDSADHGGDDCWDDPTSVPVDYTAIPGKRQPQSDEVYPGASEVYYDGVDGDCAGGSDFDADLDGFDSDSDPDAGGTVGDDCDDAEPTTYPGATDAWYDGIDADCAGNSDFDADGDGYDSDTEITTGTDCDDDRAAVNPAPSTVESCATTYDDDCDGSLDAQNATSCLTWYLDEDGDGHGTTTSECWCEAQTARNFDSTVSDDCDDDAAGTNPDEDEICDARNVDEDCDGAADNNDASALSSGKTRFYHDNDEDGYGDDTHAGSLYCDDPSNSSLSWTTDNTDCDDASATDYPGATETIGNGDDENCDGGEICYDDDDNDGYLDSSGDSRVSTDVDCDDAYEGKTTDLTTDCNDTSASINPAATEICDSANTDENCNGTADDADSTTADSGKTTYYHDDDHDGYGDENHAGARYCDDPSSSSQYWDTDNTDCDDASASDNPGATETVGNQDDEDCDGGEICYDDDDNDGTIDTTGDTRVSTDTDCTDTNEATSSDATTDCNDSNASINTSATEVCDAANTDEDCDGLADDADSSTSSSGKTRYYHDDDRDGYGDEDHSGALYCDDPSSGSQYWETDHTDCDDTDSGDNPGVTETVGNGDDEDCDGTEVCYDDDDNDGYLDTTSDTRTSTDTDCDDAYEGKTTDLTTDCDDTSATDYPGATEIVGNGDDEDCDGTEVCYDDDDNDGYLDSSGDTRTSADTDCSDTYEATNADPTTDCNDSDSATYPGATEIVGNSVDNDCSAGEICYVDGDNDGYLDAAGATVVSANASCTDSGEGESSDPTTDCDDADASAYPGAPELCDGQQNDCSTAWTTASENNKVSYVTTGGTWSDVSSSFPTSGTAASLSVASSGTYHLCAGTYHVKLSASASSASFIGRYGAASTIIDNTSSAGSVLSSSGASALSLEDLTLTGGHGFSSSGTRGGGVYATAASPPAVDTPTVTLTDCILTGNDAAYGGALAANGYAWIYLDNTIVHTNTGDYGGGIWLGTTADVSLTEGSTVFSNTADFDGGGIFVDAGGQLAIDSSFVYNNTATDQGGGLYVSVSGSATCDEGGVYGNTAAAGGGAYLDWLSSNYGSLLVTDCDFGEATTDNDPEDVAAVYNGSGGTNTYSSYDSAATFTCTGGTCAP
jgi:hypothetical protein